MKQLVYEIYNDDALDAAAESLVAYGKEHAHKSLLLHLYCGINDVKWAGRIRDRLLLDLPKAKFVGLSSHAEIINGAMTDPVMLLSAMFFDSTDVDIHVFPDALGKESKVGEACKALINTTRNIKAAEVLMQGRPVDSYAFLRTMDSANEKVQVFGGFPLGHAIGNEKYFLIGRDGVYDNALFLITYAGRDFHVNSGYTTGWESMGRTFTVTKARGSVLYEVDGFPACKLYKRYLDLDADEDFFVSAMEFPLHVEEHGSSMLRTPARVGEDGSLEMAGYVQEGMKVTMSYGDPNTIIQKVDERAEEIRRFEPQAILLYSCAMRKIFWNYFINNEMAPFQKLACTCGFFSGGEISRDMNNGKMLLHNVTMLTIAMREGEATGHPVAEAKVDASLLHGQASLVQRLTRLVRATSDELRQSLSDLVEANDKLRVMATIDELTALFNRREIERRINEALDQAAAQKGKQVSLIMMDVDHFKRVNDTCGHETGDKILEGVAAVLNALVREYDGEAAGRWGGEEFFLLLPDCSLEEAIERAEEIRQTVELYPFPKIDGLTCSLGVTTTDGSEDKKLVYSRVDDALYEAKETGRNKVVVAKTHQS